MCYTGTFTCCPIILDCAYVQHVARDPEEWCWHSYVDSLSSYAWACVVICTASMELSTDNGREISFEM